MKRKDTLRKKNGTNQIFLNKCSCLASHIRDVVIVLPWATTKRWSHWCSGPKRTKLFWKYLFALLKCCKFACWIKQTHIQTNNLFVLQEQTIRRCVCVRTCSADKWHQTFRRHPFRSYAKKRKKNRSETFKQRELCESWVTAKCRD